MRKKNVQEEVEKKRKELELELKKLVTEITDSYKTFDEKVSLRNTLENHHSNAF